MTVIAIPKILNDRLTDEGARAFVEIIERVEDSTQKITLQMAEDRFEKRLAQVEMKIEQIRSDIIRWMFIFWVGQAVTIIGFLIAFLKH